MAATVHEFSFLHATNTLIILRTSARVTADSSISISWLFHQLDLRLAISNYLGWIWNDETYEMPRVNTKACREHQ